MKNALCTCVLLMAFLTAKAQALEPENIIENIRPATLLIAARTAGATKPLGSGVIVTPSGYVLTAAHILPPFTQGTSLVGKRSSAAEQEEELELVARDPLFDAALLKFKNTAKTYPRVQVTRSSTVKPGDSVFKIGYPLSQEFEVKRGYVTGLGGQRGALVTDLLLNPGDSGAPVLNAQGLLIGIVISDLIQGQGISFVLPASHMSNLLNAAQVELVGPAPPTSYSVVGTISGTYETYEEWTQTFAHSRSDGNCDANFDDPQQYCAPDGYRLTDGGQLAVKSANCNSSVSSPKVVSSACVVVPAHIGGCGTDRVFGQVVNCKGRGWVDYTVTLRGRKANKVQLPQYVIDEKKFGGQGNFEHQLAREKLAARDWSYNVQVYAKLADGQTRVLTASTSVPGPPGLMTRMDDGVLQIRVLE